MTIPTERIIRELSQPEAYPHPVDSVEVIQTHISVIFLAGDLVYKVKKPVDFGFLDFRTLEKRHHFCKEEVRLNSRLSPDIYLRVASIVDGPQGLTISAQKVSEQTIEYAVVMKKLDENHLLSTMLEEGLANEKAIKAVAGKIALFHQKAETSASITRTGGIEAVEFNTEENFQQIKPYIGDTLSSETFERISRFTRTFLDVNRDLFTKRESDGWIRDGHGDLHTQHICLADGIHIFDCIEFNERFRYGDVLVDAAFLAMDLERLGHRDLAEVFTKHYLSLMKQNEFGALFNFYACYRAVVRGKVEGFRSRDPAIKPQEAETARENARAFFLLGEKYSRTLVPPVLIAGCGLMGSGKSSLARELGAWLDIVVLSSDRIRKEMAGLEPSSPHHVPFRSDIYSEKFSLRTYSEMHERACSHLKDGQSVFLDASYMSPALRKQVMDTARKSGARFLLLYMDPGEAELRKRLRKRISRTGSISDGREEILDDQIRAFSPPDEVPGEQRLTFTTTGDHDRQVSETYRRLLSTI